MIYTIYMDSYLVLDSLSSTRSVGNARLTLNRNNDDELTFVLYKEHPLYETIKMFDKSHMVKVYENEELLFYGLFASASLNIYGELSIRCVSIFQPMKNVHLYRVSSPFDTVSDSIKWILETVYNDMVPEFQKIYMGRFDEKDQSGSGSGSIPYSISPDKNLYSTLFDSILNPRGLSIRFRKNDGKNYMDIFKETYEDPKKSIRFAENMLSIDGTVNISDRYTAVFVEGEADPDGDRHTLAHYQYDKCAPGYSVSCGVITDDDAVEKYGFNVYVLVDDTLVTESSMIAAALDFLKKQGKIENLSVNMVDMRLIKDYESPIRIGDFVNVVHDGLNINEIMQCVSIDLNLNDPSQSSYSFGKIPETLTGILKS